MQKLTNVVAEAVFGDAPALCSANLAPTRSEYFKNLSVQFNTHCS